MKSKELLNLLKEGLVYIIKKVFSGIEAIINMLIITVIIVLVINHFAGKNNQATGDNIDYTQTYSESQTDTFNEAKEGTFLSRIYYNTNIDIKSTDNENQIIRKVLNSTLWTGSDTIDINIDKKLSDLKCTYVEGEEYDYVSISGTSKKDNETKLTIMIAIKDSNYICLDVIYVNNRAISEDDQSKWATHLFL